MQRFHRLLSASILALTAARCGPAVVAPDTAIITLSSSPTTISLRGATTITATVHGKNAEPGTEVGFTTTLGALSSDHSHTIGGQAVITLYGRGEAGTATVVATSGSVRSADLRVRIGGSLSLALISIPTSPAMNDAVQFVATPAEGTPTVSYYEWDFGDPDSGTLNTRTTTVGTATYVYTTAGSKTVTVKATAVDGTSATAVLTLSVR
jgi:PKD repeat protein